MKFRQIIITGGEPLVHTKMDKLFEVCAKFKGKGTNIVLRTNLAADLTDNVLASIAGAFDQVAVSVDGSEDTHDKRRGKGSYQKTVVNLNGYAALSETLPISAELSIACVMNAAGIDGSPGKSVRALAGKLNIKRIRFRPLLPLGRAAGLEEPVICEGMMHYISADNMLKMKFEPLITCGIGQNIFIKADGTSYPCYAWCNENVLIGNVFDEGLKNILLSTKFSELNKCTVDTIEKCKECGYRYLCGGACRAWGNQNEKNINAAPLFCDNLKKRAAMLENSAKRYLSPTP